MGKLIFITGAARSGKSAFAVRMAKEISDGQKNGKAVFLATCIPQDNEMKRRVALHKKNRPPSWKTIEAKPDILKELKGIKPIFRVVIIDCLTLFVSGLIMRGVKESRIKKKVEEITKIISQAFYAAIVVSNEVGAGVVPENKLAREFRDSAGTANQSIARRADEVYFVVSGIPVKIK